jgi:ADP-glucose pyrophosphorylase
MEDVEIGRDSRIQDAIIDKHVVIPPETHIEFDVEEDRKKSDFLLFGCTLSFIDLSLWLPEFYV